MERNRAVRLSKFMSLVLRHQPEAANIYLDDEGWAAVDALLKGMAQAGLPITEDELREVVASSDKQRFALSTDGSRIRANQGHSRPVELGLQPMTPPALLFHGTASANAASILASGLKRQRRQHVHLSADAETARKVGSRHGRPVVFQVDAAAMAAAGHLFYCSANGVWLTDAVPPQYAAMQENGSTAP